MIHIAILFTDGDNRKLCIDGRIAKIETGEGSLAKIECDIADLENPKSATDIKSNCSNCSNCLKHVYMTNANSLKFLKQCRNYSISQDQSGEGFLIQLKDALCKVVSDLQKEQLQEH